MLHTVTMELGRDGSSLAYARRALDDRHAAVVLRDGDFDPKSRRRTDHHGDTDVARGYWPGNHRLRIRFASGTRTHPRSRRYLRLSLRCRPGPSFWHLFSWAST